MIRIKKLSLTISNNQILKNINIDFSEKGLIGICGPSGCGKSSLLNCISGITAHEGEIYAGEKCVSHMSEDEKTIFRLTNFGFIFQNFNLFETETVENNIALPYLCGHESDSGVVTQRCLDVLTLCKIRHLKTKKVNTLSGGEKQRVAIARSIINQPRFLLADEPTAQLDSKNAQYIYELLQTISNKCLIIVVSHDLDLLRKYCHQIIQMNDGKIISISNNVFDSANQNLLLPKNELFVKNRLPFSFIRSHTKMCKKEKKWRSILLHFIISLGLSCVGVSFLVTSIVSSTINDEYGSLIGNYDIFAIKKLSNHTLNTRYSLNYEETSTIYHRYSDSVYDIGAAYLNDFDLHFVDNDQFAVANSTYRTPIDNLYSKHINDFLWLDLFPNLTIYPSRPKELTNDQVVLGLTISNIRNICYSLRIARNVESLSDYLLFSNLYIYLDVANSNWQYSDQQIFEVVGFVLETDEHIYHYNHLWNEYIFEKLLSFPSTDQIDGNVFYPWTLRKIYYFECQQNVDLVLTDAANDEECDIAQFDLATAKIFPTIQDKKILSSRMLVYYNTSFSFLPRISDYILALDSNIISCIFAVDAVYQMFPSALMLGFTTHTFFSFSSSLLDEVVDFNTNLNEEANLSYKLPSGVIEGHYTKTSDNGLRFNSIVNRELIVGSPPNSLDEIVVSTSLLRYLGMKEDELPHQELQIARQANSQSENSSNYINYAYTSLKVCGVVQDDNLAIYHQPAWMIHFFQTRFEMSIFNLNITGFALEIKNSGAIMSVINKIKKAFPDCEIYNPMQEIRNNVSKICSYVEIGTIGLSGMTLFIAFLLIILSLNLYYFDRRKDIGLLLCLGVRLKQAFKLPIYYVLNISFVSLFVSIFQMSVIKTVFFFSSKIPILSFDFLFSILVMFAICIFICFISLFCYLSKFRKISVVESLQQ